MATPQERASEMLALWQMQRRAGIPAEDRRIPSPADQVSFERDIAILRQLMERKS